MQKDIGNFFILTCIVFILTAGCLNTTTKIHAAFSGTPHSGQSPLSVAFTDESTGSPSVFAWFFGDENYYQPWLLQNASSGWAARTGHSVVTIPDGKILLMGGTSTSSQYNDVWKSTNYGVTWTLVNASSGWSKRGAFNSLAMPDGSMVLMGGYGSGTTNNETWRSTDEGATWIEMNASSGWSARAAESTVAMSNGDIVLMGGSPIYESTVVNDTWLSKDDGATWTLQNASSGWCARGWHSTVVMQDESIVLISGSGPTIPLNRLHDTWKSSDEGKTWVQVNSTTPWVARDHKGAVLMPDNSIVIAGGNTGHPITSNDTWRSTDEGNTWIEINVSPAFTARYDDNMVGMPDGSLIIFGGQTDTALANDTWRMQPVGSNAQNPVHQYIDTGNSVILYNVSLKVTGSSGSNTLIKPLYITENPEHL
jgi:Galactose oxidase, central domain